MSSRHCVVSCVQESESETESKVGEKPCVDSDTCGNRLTTPYPNWKSANFPSTTRFLSAYSFIHLFPFMHAHSHTHTQAHFVCSWQNISFRLLGPTSPCAVIVCYTATVGNSSCQCVFSSLSVWQKCATLRRRHQHRRWRQNDKRTNENPIFIPLDSVSVTTTEEPTNRVSHVVVVHIEHMFFSVDVEALVTDAHAIYWYCDKLLETLCADVCVCVSICHVV